LSTRDPDSRFLHRNLPLLLLHAREAVLARFRPILQAHGLTEQQWRVIRALEESGPMEPREIVERCRISSPSLAGILARMDGLGLVARERLAHDQRRLVVSLTRRSRTLAARMAPLIEAEYAAIEQRIGVEFTRELYDALDALLAALHTPGADSEDAGDAVDQSAGQGTSDGPGERAGTGRADPADD
jgi:homoprotocatechuate degradation regulator HpaR